MELYIGGFAQGKLDYVKGQYPEAMVYGKMNYEDILHMPRQEKCVWNQFHSTMRQQLDRGRRPEKLRQEVLDFVDTHQEVIIISDEIGSGIVPMEEAERTYREFTGRLLTEIARKADKVVRITCGIPTRIK